MSDIQVRVHRSAEKLERREELAWALAEFASGRPPIDQQAAAMVPCRIVDNAAVAIASLTR